MRRWSAGLDDARAGPSTSGVDGPDPPLARAGRSDGERDAARLGLLFGALYFVQGVAEPTEGLIAQPVRALLKGWGHGVEDIAAFSAVLSLPWSLKPLFGLLTDFVPLWGYRRRSYLALTSLLAGLGLVALYLYPPGRGSVAWLLAALAVPTVAVAFGDVVTDGLLVDEGRPRGLTGRLQSIQWFAMHAATLGAGVLGGWLAHNGEERLGFLVVAALALGAMGVSVLGVPERRAERRRSVGLVEAGRRLGAAARSPDVRGVAGFLFLWSFNPFQHAILYLHMTGPLGLGEQFFGNTVSILAVASMGACAVYGRLSSGWSTRALVHLSIVAGVVATLAYWGLRGETSAVLITVVVGFTYMTGSLVQLELAARVCPPETAATVFAVLMALSNLAMALATWLGGAWYEAWTARMGATAAFDLLVGVGAAFTAACWLFVPRLEEGGGSLSPRR